MTYENDEIRKQKARESVRKYRAKNKEKLAEYAKKYYNEHKDRISELAHQRYMIKKYLEQDDVDTICKTLNDGEDS